MPKKLQFKVGGNTFRCANEEYIYIIFMCDGFNDCQSDFADEKGCHCNESNSTQVNVNLLYLGKTVYPAPTFISIHMEISVGNIIL